MSKYSEEYVQELITVIMSKTKKVYKESIIKKLTEQINDQTLVSLATVISIINGDTE